MKKNMSLYLFVGFISVLFLLGCERSKTAEMKDQDAVNNQQAIYQEVQPVHMYDYSIPRDVFQQIYDVTVTRAVATYSVVETITGELKYQCPSIGYPLAADTQLTNPIQAVRRVIGNEYSAVIEQAEPNGLFSSKNTDATWVLCVDLKSHEVYPVRSEHKVTTWPFIVEQNEKKEWIRANNMPIAFKIEIKKSDGTIKTPQPPIVK